MNNPEPMQSPEQSIAEQKVLRAVGINVLRWLPAMAGSFCWALRCWWHMPLVSFKEE